jgi:probable H4MPT-linked C1 transfer pathway protein
LLSIGLDIGGANTKLVAFERRGPAGVQADGSLRLKRVRCEYFPFWERSEGLRSLLSEMLVDLLAEPCRLAVTMTAELADCYKTKKEGVQSILSTLQCIAPDSKVLLASGALVSIDSALPRPLEVASANWLAPALLLGGIMKNCMFIDVGSTTTDIIPIKNGHPSVGDPTDRGRLSNHELVYSGSLRTNLASLTERMVFHGQPVERASEYFANAADMNLLLGLLTEDQYSVPTPDGADPDSEGARARIARLICSDSVSVGMEDAVDLASFLHNEQVHQIAAHLMTVLAREGLGPELPCVVAGIGRNAVAAPAARLAGLKHVLEFHHATLAGIPVDLGDQAKAISDQAPATSLALLNLGGDHLVVG